MHNHLPLRGRTFHGRIVFGGKSLEKSNFILGAFPWFKQRGESLSVIIRAFTYGINSRHWKAGQRSWRGADCAGSTAVGTALGLFSWRGAEQCELQP